MTEKTGTALLRWLQQRAEQDRANLRLFVLGAALFFAGLGIILLAQKHLLPSLGQEIISLTGLILAAVGALFAALGYIALSILRIIRLTRKND
ncbi:MAG: hypothetical protein LRY72_11995 [Saccharospirillaceae bacterium]|nr:hypothetical protein [Saccharospirillaceae bacterium]